MNRPGFPRLRDRHRLRKEERTLIGQNKPLITKYLGKFAAMLTMPRIGAIAHTAGIVEDGEQLHDLDVGPGLPCQPQPVFQNPRPMADAVNAMPGQGIIFENPVNKGFEVEHPAMPLELHFPRPSL